MESFVNYYALPSSFPKKDELTQAQLPPTGLKDGSKLVLVEVENKDPNRIPLGEMLYAAPLQIILTNKSKQPLEVVRTKKFLAESKDARKIPNERGFFGHIITLQPHESVVHQSGVLLQNEWGILSLRWILLSQGSLYCFDLPHIHLSALEQEN